MTPVPYSQSSENSVAPVMTAGLTLGGVPAETPLDYYLSVIRRNGWKIFSIVALSLALTYGVSSLLTPVYEATATVDIDLRTPSGVLGAEARPSSLLDTDQFMATQMKLVQSDSVLRPVAEKYNLLQIEKQDRDARGLPPSALTSAPVMLRKLRVNRPPNTFLLQISYRSPDRGLSTAVANEIARSYVQHTYDLRYQSAEGLSSFMERQLEQLKAKMEKSSDRLAAFARDLNVADPEQKTAILSSRLVQLNNEYAAAQADRLRKEAAFHSTANGSLEAAQVSTQGEALAKLTERLNEAESRFALAKTQFGKNFPEYKKAAAEVQELQDQLDQTRRSIGKRVEIEFQQAVNREGMLATAVAGLKKDFDALNARSFEYQTLKRDAEADKKLYDELEQKIKEAGINAGFQNSSIRVADPARPPLKPASPDMKLNLLLAFFGSLCVAMVLVIVSDQRDATVGDAEAARNLLRLSVLGSLPLARGSGRTALPAHGEEVSSKPLPLPQVMYQEAVQALCSTLRLAPRNHQMRSVAVTSALPGEGKTLTACQLAAANARKGLRTLLIDCDLRRPCVAPRIGLPPAQGLADVLRRTASWRDVRRPLLNLPALDVLTVEPGAASLTPALGQELPRLLAEAREEYDLVVLDSPPVLGFSGPLEVAAAADGVLLLAVPGATNSRLLRHCINSLRQVGIDNLGLVLNKVTTRNTEYAYYGKYHKYYKQYGKTA